MRKNHFSFHKRYTAIKKIKALTMEEKKINQLNFMQIRNFWASKGTIHRGDSPRMGEKCSQIMYLMRA